MHARLHCTHCGGYSDVDLADGATCRHCGRAVIPSGRPDSGASRPNAQAVPKNPRRRRSGKGGGKRRIDSVVLPRVVRGVLSQRGKQLYLSVHMQKTYPIELAKGVRPQDLQPLGKPRLVGIEDIRPSGRRVVLTVRLGSFIGGRADRQHVETGTTINPRAAAISKRRLLPEERTSWER
jgi:hypothetical protein